MNNKNILITGGAGFIGSHTVNELINDNNIVIVDNSSLWRNKIGQKVAADSFTFSVKPWDKRIIDHEYHTEDGFRSEDYTIIENGVLKSFATSLYGANKAKVERAGNTSAAYVVEPGTTSIDDMIKNIDRGLIVGAISAGAPGVNGEIAGVAKNAFYIENGKIVNAVTETMISFNVVNVLNNIVDIILGMMIYQILIIFLYSYILIII